MFPGRVTKLCELMDELLELLVIQIVVGPPEACKRSETRNRSRRSSPTDFVFQGRLASRRIDFPNFIVFGRQRSRSLLRCHTTGTRRARPPSSQVTRSPPDSGCRPSARAQPQLVISSLRAHRPAEHTQARTHLSQAYTNSTTLHRAVHPCTYSCSFSLR